MSEQTLQYVDNNSFVHRADALSKLLLVLVVVVTTFQLTSNDTRGVMLACLLVLAIVFARVPLTNILKVSPLIFGIAALLGVFHLFVTNGTQVLFTLGPLTATQEGLVKGLGYFYRLSIMVTASFILIWTTDIRELMVGLVRMGIPYRYAFAIFMALRFLPIVQQEVDAVKAAHAIRGRASRSPWAHRFRLWQRYLFTVIVNGLRKAENTALAIESRGFGAYPTRSYVKDFRWSVSGIFLVILFVLLGAGLIYWEKVILGL
jgi:energy-coupling factor transport system permease protein